MFEQLGLEISPRQASIILGLLIGLAFGAMAEVSRFCFRRAVAGPVAERKSAAGVWLAGLATAMIGTQVAVAQGLISFDAHRFMVTDIPVLAIAVGGLIFGAGMVLTRGCVARLTVLAGTGNLRAVLVLLTFSVIAHATLKGVLTPIRTALSGVTLPVSSAALPGSPLIWTVLIAGAAGLAALRFADNRRNLALGALIGLLVPVAWVGTGYVLFDEFDPIALEGISFTSPATEALFWTVASSAIPAGFGVGLLGGVIAGALALSRISGRFAWQSFTSSRQTGRYLGGAALMGVGGVLAGGCTIGAGLSGVPTLSIAAVLALLSIGVGGALTARLIRDGVSSTGADQATSPTPQAA